MILSLREPRYLGLGEQWLILIAKRKSHSRYGPYGNFWKINITIKWLRWNMNKLHNFIYYGGLPSRKPSLIALRNGNHIDIMKSFIRHQRPARKIKINTDKMIEYTELTDKGARNSFVSSKYEHAYMLTNMLTQQENIQMRRQLCLSLYNTKKRKMLDRRRSLGGLEEVM